METLQSRDSRIDSLIGSASPVIALSAMQMYIYNIVLLDIIPYKSKVMMVELARVSLF